MSHQWNSCLWFSCFKMTDKRIGKKSLKVNRQQWWEGERPQEPMRKSTQEPGLRANLSAVFTLWRPWRSVCRSRERGSPSSAANRTEIHKKGAQWARLPVEYTVHKPSSLRLLLEETWPQSGQVQLHRQLRHKDTTAPLAGGPLQNYRDQEASARDRINEYTQDG